MNYMDTLPSTSSSTPAPPSPQTRTGSMAKEVAPLSPAPVESPVITEFGKETELPAEVAKAGVRMRSDSVVLPKIVERMGVAPLGDSVAIAAPPPTIALPLTDDQIAKGLHQSILSSWRWLAEWCKRQLQQVHLTITSISGKTVRTKVS